MQPVQLKWTLKFIVKQQLKQYTFCKQSQYIQESKINKQQTTIWHYTVLVIKGANK